MYPLLQLFYCLLLRMSQMGTILFMRAMLVNIAKTLVRGHGRITMETTKKYAKHGDQTRSMTYLMQLQDMTVRELSEAAEVPLGRATNFIYRSIKSGNIKKCGSAKIDNCKGGHKSASKFRWSGKPTSEGLLSAAANFILNNVRTDDGRMMAREIISHLEGIYREV